MPFLIRIIAQRLVLLILPVLAFFGLNPDISVPTPQAIEQTQQRQEEFVEKVLTTDSPEITIVEDNPTVQKVEDKITEIQKEFTQTIAEPIAEKIKETLPVQIVDSEDVQNQIEEFDIKKVVVNILCLEKTSAYTKLSTGSGVLISDTGLVITNAHVAYPFLLSSQFDKNIYSCSVRRADLPNFGYNAELVYYPIDWITYNSEVIKETVPMGTGENDYALLAITSPLALAPKSTTFPFASVDVSSSDLKSNIPVTVAGYPSSNSGVFEIDTNPGLKIAQTEIKEFFTFSNRSFDILQTDVNVVAKRGSSGGGVFDSNKLYGIIVTTNQKGDGSYLNALTIPYIKKDFEKDTGIKLDTFIGTSIGVLKTQFSISYKDSLKNFISEN